MEDKKIYFFFVLLFLLGIFVGQFIGYYRAWKDYALTEKFVFNSIFTDLNGNTTVLENFKKPFSCAIFERQNEALNFYKQILEPSFYKKTVCFKGD